MKLSEYLKIRNQSGVGLTQAEGKAMGVDRVARQTPPFMAGKDSADSNAVVKSDCL